MSYTTEQRNIIEKVETFIQRLQNLDYSINSANITPVKRGIQLTLGATMTQYEQNKDHPSLEVRLRYAKKCLRGINHAFARGLIQEGKGLISKNKELERNNKHLRERLDECSKRCQELEKENKRLQKLFGYDTLVGGVGDE